MGHGGIDMLKSKYFGTRVNQGKVVVEQLDHPNQIGNSHLVFPFPKIGAVGVQAGDHSV